MNTRIWHRLAQAAWTVAATTTLFAAPTSAATVTVTDPTGKPIATVMVSRQPVKAAVVDTSDNGYPANGKPQQALFEVARFTDASGRAELPAADHPWQIRLRKPGLPGPHRPGQRIEQALGHAA
jgi:hypothetical protein